MKIQACAMTLALLMGLSLSCDRRGGREVRIAAIGCYTGEASTYGLSQRRAYEMAAEEWNARGGLLGRPIRLVMVDDRGEPAEGVTAFTKVVERDKVAGILGATISRVALAGAPIAQAAHIPMVTPSATHPRVTEAGNFIFRACYLDTFQGVVGARFAFQDLKVRRAACLFDVGNDYTKGLAESFQTTFTSLGGQVVRSESHPTGVTDFKAQLTTLLQARPELIYLPDYYGDVALIARQARDLGYRGPFLGGDGWDSPKLVEMGGGAVEPGYFICHYALDDPRPEVQGFVERFRARFHTEPDSLGTLAYDAAYLLFDAIRRAGSLEGPAIREALASTDLPLVTARFRFDARRDPIKTAAILELRGGRKVFRTTVAP